MESVSAEIVAMRSWSTSLLVFRESRKKGLVGTYVWADNRCDDGSGDDDPADTQACEDEDPPELVEVVLSGDCHCAAAWFRTLAT